MAKPHKHMIKLKEIELTELLDFEVQFSFDILRNGVMHGLMFWFDVGFIDGRSFCNLKNYQKMRNLTYEWRI